MRDLNKNFILVQHNGKERRKPCVTPFPTNFKGLQEKEEEEE
jgi:hypothetical protein